MKLSENWKTPLGYYERTIAETVKIREEFQAELQVIRTFQAAHKTLVAELQTAQKEIQTLKAELQGTKAELQTSSKHLEEYLSQIKKIAVAADIEAKAAQNSVKTACSEIKAIQVGIENGSIVAQKALMLRARDDNHWMRFKYVKEARNVEYDTFLVWKGDDTWQHTIRVGAADKLRP